MTKKSASLIILCAVVIIGLAIAAVAVLSKSSAPDIGTARFVLEYSDAGRL